METTPPRKRKSHRKRVHNVDPREFKRPRYWSTWCGLAFIWLVARLPRPLLMKFGAGLGWLSYIVAGRRRRIAARNLELCFPELSSTDQRQLLRRTMVDQGLGLAETAWAWFNDAAKWRSRIDVHGLEHLQEAIDQQRGVLLIGSHFTTLDIAGAFLSLLTEFDPMYRQQKNPLVNHLMLKSRSRYGNPIERTNIRGVLRSLRKGRVVWYPPDQDYGPNHSVFVPFFGVETATITATSRFAKLNDSPVLFIRHYRTDDRKRYIIEFTPTLDNFPVGDDIQDTTRVSEMIEEGIRKKPEQYMWVHRRFKTRPEGEKSLYF